MNSSMTPLNFMENFSASFAASESSKNNLNEIAGYATRTVVKNRMKLQREIEEGTVTV